VASRFRPPPEVVIHQSLDCLSDAAGRPNRRRDGSARCGGNGLQIAHVFFVQWYGLAPRDAARFAREAALLRINPRAAI
jgi:hypothetical protein